MFNPHPFNFDLDGDGVADSYAEKVDLDGDGVIDGLSVDLDGDGTADMMLLDTDHDGALETTLLDSDGNGYFETALVDQDGDGQADYALVDLDEDGVYDQTLLDSDGDGSLDTMVAELDTDGDGVVDTVVKSYDYDQDGTADSVTIYRDTDQDGAFDMVSKQYDSDSDGVMDTTRTWFDFDEDGKADAITEEQLLDSDGDGQIDTYISRVDSDGDGAFEAVEVYGYEVSNGQVELIPLEPDQTGVSGTRWQDLENFDPDNADPDDVAGDPGRSMEEWEFQGETNRCALYSQKFVIEELTGRDIDIEELADLAEENGWFSEEGGTPLLNMDKVLDYYGVDSEMSFHNGIDDIEDCLNSGGKVIVSIDADEIWYGESDDLFTPSESANHAVEVIGIDHSDPDNPMVILNDSGSPDGCGEMIPLDTFLDAWEDGNCQMISCM